MGKMKLTKNNKRSAAKGSSGIPNWLLTTIIGVIILAVLLTCLVTFIASSGVLNRVSTAMKSEDYKVDGNMMLYFYSTTYNNFASQYSSYLKYISLGEGTPMSEHHKIVIGSDEKTAQYDNALFSDYKGKTWFQYFMAQTEESVKSMLVYCEAADDLGVELTKDDIAAIDAEIQELIDSCREYNGANISEDVCLRMMFGEGIGKSDVRRAMKITSLSTKCATKIYEDVEAAVTDERIDKEYTDNKLDYNVVDYFYYTFGVSYDDVVEEVLKKEDYTDKEVEDNKAAILEAYKAKIEETRALAKELAALTELEAFKNYVLNYAANKSYDDLLEAEDLKSEDLPSEENLKKIKEKMVAAALAEVLEKKEEAKDDVVTTKGEGDAADTYTIYEISITKNFAESAKDIKDDLFANIASRLKSNDVKKDTYVKDDKFAEWAFKDERKIGEINTFEEGDGTGEGEFKVEDEEFTTSVYFLTNTQRRDEDKARDVAYLLFTSTDTAKKAIEKLKAIEGGVTKEKLAAIGTELAASVNTVIEDYTEGQMQSASFDSWLYDEKTAVGTYTDSVITMSDGSSMVALYLGEGEACWKVTVKSALIEDDFSEREADIIAKYSSKITKNDSVIGRIGK